MLALVLAPAMAKDMPDVPFTHWAYDAVDELTDIGILQGYPDGTYKGQRTLTRYEFAEATVKLVHYLENYVDEKTAALEAGVDAAEARAIAKDEAAKAVAAIKLPTFDMTMDQVRAAAAAAGAQAAKDALAGMSPGVTKAEVQAMIDGAVRNLVTKDYVDNLAAEFRADIQELGVDVDDLMYRVDQLEAKLVALDGRVTASRTSLTRSLATSSGASAPPKTPMAFMPATGSGSATSKCASTSMARSPTRPRAISVSGVRMPPMTGTTAAPTSTPLTWMSRMAFSRA